MRLKRLRIENFKAIEGPVELEFGNLTFLYGPNSAGKSAVLDALDLFGVIAAGDKDAAEKIAHLTHTRPDGGALAIGVTVFVDGHSIDTAVDTTKFQELEGLIEALRDGAELDMQIRMTRYGVESLEISINQQPLLAYEYTVAKYGPYFETHPTRTSELERICPVLALEGEWRINTAHALSRDLLFKPQESSARSRIAFGDIEDIWVVRGASCSLPLEVELGDETLEFIHPRHAADIAKGGDVDSPLYRNPTQIFLADNGVDHKLIHSHERYLRQFVLSGEKAEVDHYLNFLRSEFSAENSAQLFFDLRRFASRMGAFIREVFSTAAQTIQLPRVPGSRPSVNSHAPVHLLSDYGKMLEEEPYATRSVVSAVPLYAPNWSSGEYFGARALVGKFASSHDGLGALLSPYAWRCLFRSLDQITKEDDSDFPNFCLRRYLHSLSKYQVVAEIYRLENDLYAPDEDDSELTGTRLVYFVLRDSKGARRTFKDVGTGLGYIFPILAVLGEHELCAIEQPELHLHPRAQEQLADVFVHFVSRSLFTRQLIVESHSEAFLLQVAERIRQTYESGQQHDASVSVFARELQLVAESVRVYYFDPRPGSGTEVLPIGFAPNGSLIDAWPDGMFSKDWSTGLDRLRLFSQEFDASEASRAWPWIEDISNTTIRRWLGSAWCAEKLGEAFADSTVIYWAKIVEQVLIDQLLAPLKQGTNSAPGERDDRLRPKLEKFWRSDESPGLGWWKHVLVALRVDRGPKLHFKSQLREHINEQPWGASWNAQLSDLIRLLDKLNSVRNPAAHVGKVDLDAIASARCLLIDGERPGLLFRVFGAPAGARRGPKGIL